MKRLSTVLLLSIFPALINAAEGLHLNIGPLAGIKTGHVGEYVFSDADTSDYEKMSYLQWNTRPEWYGGGIIELTYNRLHISTDITAGLPGKCGEMQDSDWMNIPTNYTKTNYSVSDNYIQTDIKSGLTVSYDFKPDSVVTLSPFAGFDFEYYKFDAKNLTSWYGEQDTTTGLYSSSDSAQKKEEITDGSSVCLYKWYSYITWIGLGTNFRLSKRWDFGISGAVAPWIFIYAEDDHLTRSMYTAAAMSAFFCAFKTDLSIYYHINDRLTAGLTGYITMSSTLSANTKTKYSESADYKDTPNTKDGSDFHFGGCTLSIKYQIF